MAQAYGPVLLALDSIMPRSAVCPPDDGCLVELVESMRVNGVRNPLLVRPMGADTYRLVLGDRMWHAARLAGLTEVPALVCEMTEEELSDLALAEVLARWDDLQE